VGRLVLVGRWRHARGRRAGRRPPGGAAESLREGAGASSGPATVPAGRAPCRSRLLLRGFCAEPTPRRARAPARAAARRLRIRGARHGEHQARAVVDRMDFKHGASLLRVDQLRKPPGTEFLIAATEVPPSFEPRARGNQRAGASGKPPPYRAFTGAPFPVDRPSTSTALRVNVPHAQRTAQSRSRAAGLGRASVGVCPGRRPRRGRCDGSDEVSVVDPRGNLLGRGLLHAGIGDPGEATRARRNDAPGRRFLSGTSGARESGFAPRWGCPASKPTACASSTRGDGFAGLIVDRYGDALAVQFGTRGMKQREALVHEALQAVVAPRSILDRTSVQMAKIEQFTPSSGVVRGDEVARSSSPKRGLRFRIPLELGQKTGFYFDQRSLRARVEQLAARQARARRVFVRGCLRDRRRARRCARGARGRRERTCRRGRRRVRRYERSRRSRELRQRRRPSHSGRRKRDLRPGHRRPAQARAHPRRARAGARCLRQARRETRVVPHVRVASSCSAPVPRPWISRRSLARSRPAPYAPTRRLRCSSDGFRAPTTPCRRRSAKVLYLKALIARVEAR